MQDEADTRRIAIIKNSLYGLFAWILPIVPLLAATPIIIKGLGAETYGIYILILGFTSYFLTYGFGKVATKYIAEYRSKDEHGKISEIVSATILLTFSLSFASTAVLAIFARTIVIDFLQIPAESAESAVIAFYLACSIILIGSVANVYQYVLQGLHRFDRYMILMNIGSLVLASGNVIVVYLGYGIVAIFVCNLLIQILLTAISRSWVRSLLPEFRFTFRFGGDAWTAVWRYAIQIFGYQLFGNILFLFERIWVTRRFGSESLTFYAVPMALAMYIHLFTGNLVSALFPVVNELLDDKIRLSNLYNKAMKLVLAIVGFAVVTAIVGGRAFLGHWVGPDFADKSYGLLIIHTVTFGIVALIPIIWQIAEGFKRASINSYTTFVWMAVSIPLMIVLSSPYGSEGVAIGRLTGAIVFIPAIFFVESRFVGGVSVKLWIANLVRIVPAAVLAGLVELTLLNSFPTSWPLLIMVCLSGATVYGIFLILTGFFAKDEKDLLLKLIDPKKKRFE